MDRMDTDSMDDVSEETPEQETPAEDSGESMEALLAQQSALSERLSSKALVWVKVISVAGDRVLVDVGEKNEGVVPLSEFEKAPAAGQRVAVVRVGARREGGMLLSHQRARAELGWEAVVKSHADKARVRGRVTSAVKGGFLVDVGGVSGFLPASLADLRPVRDPARLVGMGVRCLILELDSAKRQVVLSRKAVLEEETAKRRAKLLEELRPGEVRIGRITAASPAGLAVDIGGLEGFVRAADVAWGEPKATRLKRGDKIRVKVLSKPSSPTQSQMAPRTAGLPATPPPETRVLLGIKQLTPNPADALKKRFPPKTVVKGQILEAGPAGLKIALDPKTTAVCAPADMDSDEPLKAGDTVSAVVLGVNPSTFHVVVSVSRFNEARDRKKAAQYLKAPKPLTLGQLLSPDKDS